MNKYPLVGVSILVVVLLILGSLSNVVGYQTIQSSGVNDSPLFSARTQRATNRQQNSIIPQYLGKGTGNIWQFPPPDNNTESLKTIFEIIKKMDDATFQRFLISLQQRVKEASPLNSQKLHEITNGLTELRKQTHLPLLSPAPLHTYGCPSTDLTCAVLAILYIIKLGICFLFHSLFPNIFPTIL
jgi:hypothetical protein